MADNEDTNETEETEEAKDEKENIDVNEENVEDNEEKVQNEISKMPVNLQVEYLRENFGDHPNWNKVNVNRESNDCKAKNVKLRKEEDVVNEIQKLEVPAPLMKEIGFIDDKGCFYFYDDKGNEMLDKENNLYILEQNKKGMFTKNGVYLRFNDDKLQNNGARRPTLDEIVRVRCLMEKWLTIGEDNTKPKNTMMLDAKFSRQYVVLNAHFMPLSNAVEEFVVKEVEKEMLKNEEMYSNKEVDKRAVNLSNQSFAVEEEDSLDQQDFFPRKKKKSGARTKRRKSKRSKSSSSGKSRNRRRSKSASKSKDELDNDDLDELSKLLLEIDKEKLSKTENARLLQLLLSESKNESTQDDQGEEDANPQPAAINQEEAVEEDGNE